MLTHREATVQDVEQLATMNRQLIEDEKHPRNILMTMPQLQERMRGFLADDYHAILFERDGRAVAYALYRDRGDSIYLRQFFVARDCRREGLGRKAMSILRGQVWPAGRRLTVEVLVSNHTGLCFWRAVGYRDYCIELEILPDEGSPASQPTGTSDGMVSAATTADAPGIPGIQVLPGTDADLPVVENLARFYVYDFTEFTGWQCPESGLFGGCDDLFDDWRAGTNKPFVIRVGGELAGFAGVKDLDGPDGIEHDVQQFFILRKFRRRGVGRHVAIHLFETHPGRWRIRQLAANTPALAFWRTIIGDYAANHFTETRTPSPWGEENTIRFDNGPSSYG